MAIQPLHELHARRKGRNMALGLILGGLIVMIFAVTLVKLSKPQTEDIYAPNYTPVIGASE